MLEGLVLLLDLKQAGAVFLSKLKSYVFNKDGFYAHSLHKTPLLKKNMMNIIHTAKTQTLIEYFWSSF